jgi:hypothetical protein
MQECRFSLSALISGCHLCHRKHTFLLWLQYLEAKRCIEEDISGETCGIAKAQKKQDKM